MIQLIHKGFISKGEKYGRYKNSIIWFNNNCYIFRVIIIKINKKEE